MDCLVQFYWALTSWLIGCVLFGSDRLKTSWLCSPLTGFGLLDPILLCSDRLWTSWSYSTGLWQVESLLVVFSLDLASWGLFGYVFPYLWQVEDILCSCLWRVVGFLVVFSLALTGGGLFGWVHFVSDRLSVRKRTWSYHTWFLVLFYWALTNWELLGCASFTLTGWGALGCFFLISDRLRTSWLYYSSFFHSWHCPHAQLMASILILVLPVKSRPAMANYLLRWPSRARKLSNA